MSLEGRPTVMRSEARDPSRGKFGPCAAGRCPSAAAAGRWCAAPPSRCACGRPARFVVDARAPWGRWQSAEPACSACAYLARRGYAVRVRPLELLAAVCGDGGDADVPRGPVRYVAGGAACLVSRRRRRAAAALELLEVVRARELAFVEVPSSTPATSPAAAGGRRSSSAIAKRVQHIIAGPGKAFCGQSGPFQFSIPSLDLLCFQCARALRAQARKDVK